MNNYNEKSHPLLAPDSRLLQLFSTTHKLRHQPNATSKCTAMITHPEITEEEVKEYWDSQYKVRKGFLPEYNELDQDELREAIEQYENLYISTYER